MLRDNFSKIQANIEQNSHLDELQDGSLKTRLDQMLMKKYTLKRSPHGHTVLERQMGNDQEMKYAMYYWSHAYPCIENFKGTELLAKIAERLTAAPHSLAELARHRNHKVRLAVAENEYTPPQSLLMLANDEHPDVRYTVAENYRCPLPVLIALTDDENPYIAFRAARTLMRLRGAEVLEGFFGNSSCSEPCEQQEQQAML